MLKVMDRCPESCTTQSSSYCKEIYQGCRVDEALAEILLANVRSLAIKPTHRWRQTALHAHRPKKKKNPTSMCNHAEAPSHVNKLSVSGGDELVSGH